MKTRTQTKVGYVPIYRSTDYGGRLLANRDDDQIYEDKDECEMDSRNDDDFVAVATMTWEEKT